MRTIEESTAAADTTPATVLEFDHASAKPVQGGRKASARAQNFLVEWFESELGTTSFTANSPDEILVLCFDGSVSATRQDKSLRAQGAAAMILAAGEWKIALSVTTRCAVLTSVREGVRTDAMNDSNFPGRNEMLVGVGTPYRRNWNGELGQVLPIDEVRASPDKPRLKMLQTSTMSINWVDYDGPRDRTALSPHSHQDFEQGSLAVYGDFAHHLRTEWASNANEWKSDRHAHAGSPSLLVVPARTIHTSEGVGPGRHLLIDIFSPPRKDFIANGWVFNSGDYVQT